MAKKTLRKDIRQDEEIWQSDKHVLFVEGKDENAIDPLVLEILLKDIIYVKPMGSSYHVKSVAQALHKHHPDYYFLIDRDHSDDSFVEKCWQNFPDPATHNLLVWFRRELENYFLIPEYLLKSQYITVSEDTLRQHIRDTFQKRFYLETANRVIVYIREELKNKWIALFEKPHNFKTKETAINQLTNIPAFNSQTKKMDQLLSQNNLEELFYQFLNQFTGGHETMDFGCGQWLELMRGKKVLPTIINHCFEVKNMQGKFLHGKVKLNEVVKDLIRKSIPEQPDDFKRLYKIISRRIQPT
ncbi:hypothetical protein [Candidatus Parabeggiatoa sp. HSG14]|uniref:hypothetical protein n=1 Tax=Candidatus Parabeggiatoa sp. HSG14 TaxID=3055593 RepID=UPI0025A799D6|nr:hypothetical protein [Thiotrichales bacterium HSG14]